MDLFEIKYLQMSFSAVTCNTDTYGETETQFSFGV